jgi:hypothetical protein
MKDQDKKKLIEHVRAITQEGRFNDLFLCEKDVESFGFFLLDWCDEFGIDQHDLHQLQKQADRGEHGVAWIMSISIDNKIKGVALFTGHAGSAAEDVPELEEIFESTEKAKTYMRTIGVIASYA